jgi:hypothetical protein
MSIYSGTRRDACLAQSGRACRARAYRLLLLIQVFKDTLRISNTLW